MNNCILFDHRNTSLKNDCRNVSHLQSIDSAIMHFLMDQHDDNEFVPINTLIESKNYLRFPQSPLPTRLNVECHDVICRLWMKMSNTSGLASHLQALIDPRQDH